MGFVAETLASKLQTVDAKDIAVDASRLITQANAFVVPFRLRRNEEAASFVFKHVDISKVKYRDAEHRERTRRSYACECAFYALCPRVDEITGCVETPGDVPGVLFIRPDHNIGSYDAFLIPPVEIHYKRRSKQLSGTMEEEFKSTLRASLVDAATAAGVVAVAYGGTSTTSPSTRKPGDCWVARRSTRLTAEERWSQAASPLV